MAAIKPPSWAKNAIPTPAGWRDPRSNELLKSQKISQDQIDSYLGVAEKKSKPKKGIAAEKVEEVIAPQPAPTQLNEAPVNHKSLDEMTKIELEATGRQHGIELDRRKSKGVLVEELKSVIIE